MNKDNLRKESKYEAHHFLCQSLSELTIQKIFTSIDIFRFNMDDKPAIDIGIIAKSMAN